MIQFKNEDEREDILNCLAENMNEEFQATLQYICHRISAKGRNEVLADSFKSAALDEMSHILFFSDLITKCGGEPRFAAWSIDQSQDLAAMLAGDIALEKKARERYRRQIERFAGYPELSAVLKNVLEDETDHEALFSDYLARIA